MAPKNNTAKSSYNIKTISLLEINLVGTYVKIFLYEEITKFILVVEQNCKNFAKKSSV